MAVVWQDVVGLHGVDEALLSIEPPTRRSFEKHQREERIVDHDHFL